MIHLRIVLRLRKHGCLPPVPHTPSSHDPSLSRGTASYVPISGDCLVGAVQYAILKVVNIYLCVCVCVCVCACARARVCVCTICDVMWKPRELTFAFSWISVYICTQPDSTAGRKVGSQGFCTSGWGCTEFHTPALRKQPPSGLGMPVHHGYTDRDSIRQAVLLW